MLFDNRSAWDLVQPDATGFVKTQNEPNAPECPAVPQNAPF